LLQPSGAVEGWVDNPVDDQNTVYGLTVVQGTPRSCSSLSASVDSFVSSMSLGGQYPRGLFVAQNGEAPEPPNTDPVNGYEFDGSTQFLYLDFRDALEALQD
jgi:hypothetical protein